MKELNSLKHGNPFNLVVLNWVLSQGRGYLYECTHIVLKA